jgi:CDP-diacylglycerol--glycerol-3-phosphate 3-phosphatidyltransferase
MVTVPNIISIGRLLAVPVLVILSHAGHGDAFLALLAVSLLSDSIDGVIARRLHQVTDFGAQLDSWADLANFASLPLCCWWLWPGVVERQAPYITTVIVSYVAPVLFSVIKFGHLPSYHSWGAKLTTVGIGASALLLFGPWRMEGPFRVFAVLAVAVACEELAISVVLRRWQVNVPTVWHAWRIRRQGDRKG